MKLTELQDAVDYVFNRKVDEGRFISGFRGCITHGYKRIDDLNHCGDNDCPSCNMYSEAVREEIKKQIYEK